MFVALLSAVFCAVPTTAPDTIVVCSPAFVQPLTPWLEHRSQQGHRIKFVSNQQTPQRIRDAIRAEAASGALRAVVLVGDVPTHYGTAVPNNGHGVPTHFVRAKVNVHWGSEPAIATDNAYADLDDDGIPDLAIGRMTADSREELTVMVDKILNYEKRASHGMWRRRVNFVAGVGGFGKIVDTVLEMATKKFLTDGIPASYRSSMTYGSWRSQYCPDPRQFHQATLHRFNEGCLFWVYIGHGQRNRLDHIRVPGANFHILGADDTHKIMPVQGSPIAIFLACYTGAFDDPRDCLAEHLLKTQGGPVAVLCGSRVTMPYAMSVMGHELLSEYFSERRETLGEVVLNAKRGMVSPGGGTKQLTNRFILDSIAKAISPSAELLDDERAEHLQLFNLLGDPLLRLHHPEPVSLDVPDTIHAGDSLQVSGSTSVAGRGVIELVCRRDRTTVAPPARPSFNPDDDALAKYNEVYLRANDPRWAWQHVQTVAGEFQTQITVPEDARGPCHVRVFIEGEDQCALGASDVFVRVRPKTDQDEASESAEGSAGQP